MTLVDRLFDAPEPRRQIPTAGSLSPSSQPLAGRRVVVTGGTAGLGLALVRELLARGADVAFVARRPGGVVRVTQEFGRPHGVIGDVSSKDHIPRIALQILRSFNACEVLLNKA